MHDKFTRQLGLVWRAIAVLDNCFTLQKINKKLLHICISIQMHMITYYVCTDLLTCLKISLVDLPVFRGQ